MLVSSTAVVLAVALVVLRLFFGVDMLLLLLLVPTSCSCSQEAVLVDTLQTWRRVIPRNPADRLSALTTAAIIVSTRMKHQDHGGGLSLLSVKTRAVLLTEVVLVLFWWRLLYAKYVCVSDVSLDPNHPFNA